MQSPAEELVKKRVWRLKGVVVTVYVLLALIVSVSKTVINLGCLVAGNT